MITVNDIAKLLDGEIIGEGTTVISGLSKIEEAKIGSLSFIANSKYEKYLETTEASCVLIGKNIDVKKFLKLPPSLILLDDPYSSFVVAIQKFNPAKRDIEIGIHSTAVIHPTAKIGTNAAIAPYVVIGENVTIGNNAVLHPNVVVGRDVKIGNDSLIYANVTIREECVIGSRVIIQPGAVIGGDGFGFAPKRDKTYQKIPQLGIVIVEDDVEIQANTCIDRATLGETRIKRGTKLDNLVQIAHNVVVGEDTVIAGQSGVAGSTKIGDRNMIGGAVAITGHVFTANDVKVSGGSTVSGQLDDEGETVAGYPAKDIRKWRRIEGATRQLPELLFEIRDMQKKILELETELKRLKEK